MDWLLLFYAMLIAIAIIAGIIMFIYLLFQYEEASLVLVCIFVFAIAVYGIYLLLGGR